MIKEIFSRLLRRIMPPSNGAQRLADETERAERSVRSMGRNRVRDAETLRSILATLPDALKPPKEGPPDGR